MKTINSKARAIFVQFSNGSSSPSDQPSGSGSRLSPLTTPPCERSPHMTLNLQEIIIVGSACEQAKFSELTMDMFRYSCALRTLCDSIIHPMSFQNASNVGERTLRIS